MFSRSSVGGMRQGIRDVKEAAILRKVLFWWLGVLRFVLGSSLVFYTRLKGEVQGIGILRNSTFCASAGGVALRRGDGSVATVVARVASGKKVRIYENSRTVGAAILHILAHERVP